MSEEEPEPKAEEKAEEPTSNEYSYPFITDERMLRCFVFEVATTHCETLFSTVDLDEIFQWIDSGKIPPKLVSVK